MVIMLFLLSQWGDIIRLTTANGLSYVSNQNARSVAAANDTVWVVWSDNRNGRWQIYYKLSTNGGSGWSADAMVADSGFCPTVVIPYPIGTQSIWGSVLAYCAFMTTKYGNWEIMTSFYSKSYAQWITARFTTESHNSIYPSIAADSSYILLLWMDDRTGNWEIRFRRSTDYGTTWSADSALTINSGHSWFPQAALNRQKFYVVWQDNRTGNFEIYFKKSTNAGRNWSSDSQLTSTTSQSYWPTIAVKDNYIYVAYIEKGDELGRGYDDEIYFIRSTDEGNTWSSPINLSVGIENNFRTGDQYNSICPSIVANKNFVGLVRERAISIDNGGQQSWQIEFRRSSDYGQTWQATWTTLALCNNDDTLVWAPSLCADPVKDMAYVTWWKLVSATNAEVYIRKGTGVIGVDEWQYPAEQISDFNCALFPNPFTKELNIKFPDLVGQEYTIKIYDSSGRLIKEFCIDPNQNTKIQSLKWGELDNHGNSVPPGVYFILLKLREKCIWKKVCKLE